MTQQLIAVLSAIADPIFFWKDHIITYANPACQALGLTAGSSLPAPCEPMPREGEAAQTSLSVAGTAWTAVVRPVEDEYLLVLRRDQQDAIQAVLSAAARSLQDPLTSMFSAGASLFPLLEELENETIQAHTATLAKSFFRLLRTKTALLEACLLDGRAAPVFFEKTNLKDYFEQLVSVWTDLLLESGIELDYRGPQKAFLGNVDQQLLQQAVLQLLSNAAQYQEKETPIVLSVSYLGDKVKIQVENRGPGMPEDVFATAFTRYQADAPLPDARWGMGLGLALAKKVAEAHGGTILLQSGSNGTCVVMTAALNLPESDLNTPRIDFSGKYDPALVELSGVLPNKVYDSRNIDL